MTKKRKRPGAKKPATRPQVSYAQASDASAKHAERLRQQGAHSIRVVPGPQGHLILAEVPPDFKGTLPAKVGATVKGKKVEVPVKTKKAPRYKPERL